MSEISFISQRHRDMAKALPHRAWQDLPEEALACILDLTGFPARLAAAQACKRWRSLVAELTTIEANGETSIADAVEAAKPGYTIRISTPFSQDTLLIDKPLRLVGAVRAPGCMDGCASLYQLRPPLVLAQARVCFQRVVFCTSASCYDASICAFGPDCEYMRFERCCFSGATGLVLPQRKQSSTKLILQECELTGTRQGMVHDLSGVLVQAGLLHMINCSVQGNSVGLEVGPNATAAIQGCRLACNSVAALLEGRVLLQDCAVWGNTHVGNAHTESRMLRAMEQAAAAAADADVAAAPAGRDCTPGDARTRQHMRQASPQQGGEPGAAPSAGASANGGVGASMWMSGCAAGTSGTAGAAPAAAAATSGAPAAVSDGPAALGAALEAARATGGAVGQGVGGLQLTPPVQRAPVPTFHALDSHATPSLPWSLHKMSPSIAAWAASGASRLQQPTAPAAMPASARTPASAAGAAPSETQGGGAARGACGVGGVSASGRPQRRGAHAAAAPPAGCAELALTRLLAAMAGGEDFFEIHNTVVLPPAVDKSAKQHGIRKQVRKLAREVYGTSEAGVPDWEVIAHSDLDTEDDDDADVEVDEDDLEGLGSEEISDDADVDEEDDDYEEEADLEIDEGGLDSDEDDDEDDDA